MRRHLAYAAAGAVALALAGCGGDDPTPKVADPTSAPSASSSASDKAAEKEPWEEKSDDGAIAFVEHWMDTFNHMQVTGEQSELRAISGPGCTTCSNFLASTSDVYDTGGEIKTRGWKVDQIGLSSATDKNRRLVAVRIEQAPQTVIAGDGERREFPGGPLTMTATITWTSSGWTLTGLEAQS